MFNSQYYIEKDKNAMLETYNRYPVVIEKGKGATATDVDGKKYIDFAAGIRLCAKTGDFVKAGDPIAILYAEKESCFARAEAKLLEATHLGDVPPAEAPLILDVVE